MNMYLATNSDYDKQRYIITIKKMDGDYSLLICHYATDPFFHPDIELFDATGQTDSQTALIHNNLVDVILSKQIVTKVESVLDDAVSHAVFHDDIFTAEKDDEYLSLLQPTKNHDSPVMDISYDVFLCVNGLYVIGYHKLDHQVFDKRISAITPMMESVDVFRFIRRLNHSKFFV